MFIEDQDDINTFNNNLNDFGVKSPLKTNNLMNSSISPKSRRDSFKRPSRSKQELPESHKKNRNSMFVHSSDVNSESENSKKSNSKGKRGSLHSHNQSPVSIKSRKSMFSNHKSNTQPVNVQVIRLSAFNNDKKIKKATKKKRRIIEEMDEKKKDQPAWVNVSILILYLTIYRKVTLQTVATPLP